MKRYFLAAMLFTMMTIFSAGCSRNEHSKTASALAKERQTEIMECFINKDGETLKSFFSEYIIENYPDLDTQIETALNFLDGEIVSYDEPFPSAMGSFDRKYYGGDTRNIITDKDTEYRITDKDTEYRIIFHGYLTNDEKPKEVGVYCITVINMTEAEKLPDRVYIGKPQ